MQQCKVREKKRYEDDRAYRFGISYTSEALEEGTRDERDAAHHPSEASHTHCILSSVRDSPVLDIRPDSLRSTPNQESGKEAKV